MNPENRAPTPTDETDRWTDVSEANLLWDEYKYRHDLIWRHLIRSTLALLALVTIRYTTAFDASAGLIVVAWLIALGYWGFTFWTVDGELKLFTRIKALYRQRQAATFPGLHPPTISGSFERKVTWYLAFLLAATFIVGLLALFDV